MNDLSDPKDVRKAAKAARQADATREEIMRGLMSLPPGRAWMYHLLKRCHCFHTTFSGNGLHSAFQEGERNIGLELLSDVMAAAPDQFIAMLREANNERITRDSQGLNGDDRRPESDATGDDAGYANYADPSDIDHSDNPASQYGTSPERW